MEKYSELVNEEIAKIYRVHAVIHAHKTSTLKETYSPRYNNNIAWYTLNNQTYLIAICDCLECCILLI